MSDAAVTRMFPLAAALAALTVIGAPAIGRASPGHQHGVDFGTPAEARDAGRTIPVTIGDTAFEPSAITLKRGETVRFIIHNASAAQHEFNLGTSAMHAQHRQEMAAMAEQGMFSGSAGHDHGAMMMHHHDEPNRVMVAPGTTRELVWTFTRSGDLEFACDIPGHYEAGMVGRLTVAP